MPALHDKKSARRRIAAPTLAMLPRVGDSLSFLYADVVRIVQDDTGVCAETTTINNDTTRVYIPTAALSCVLLGPGTSITQPALATFARHGTTVVCVGSGVVRCYSSTVPTALTTRWLEQQVHHWSDPDRRLDVARRMYTMRFKTPVPAATTLQQLRGLEGQRMKTLYKLLAQQHRIGRFRRNYDPDAWDTQDPVNLALSSANTCLYGIVHAALIALGCSPALGYVHQGTQLAFVYDIADLYKAESPYRSRSPCTPSPIPKRRPPTLPRTVPTTQTAPPHRQRHPDTPRPRRGPTASRRPQCPHGRPSMPLPVPFPLASTTHVTPMARRV